MDIKEFSNEFDVLYNNIMSNQAPGLDEYEKSVFLTKAQDYIDFVFTFQGEPVGELNQFPRRNLDNYDETTIPPAVRLATLYVASHLIEGLPILEGQKPQSEIKREVIAANRIETEYATNYKDNIVQGYVMLDAPLYILRRAGLLSGTSSGGVNLFGLRG